MPEFHFAMYHSKSRVPRSSKITNEILAVSQKNNAKDNLTGFLHCEGDFFIQYIEGPRTPLYNTLARIGRDTRHENFKLLCSGPTAKQMFPKWNMGFVSPGQLQLTDLLGVTDCGLDFEAIDPFDLVVLLVNNSDSLEYSDSLV